MVWRRETTGRGGMLKLMARLGKVLDRILFCNGSGSENVLALRSFAKMNRQNRMRTTKLPLESLAPLLHGTYYR
jgi:hypothetical protein